MKIESRVLEDWKVIAPDQDRLDSCVAEDFRRCLLEAIEDGTENLVLDLSGVEFMDSSGLGAIVYCLQRLGRDGRVAVAGAQESVALLLRLTHMDRVFTVVDEVEDVLQETT